MFSCCTWLHALPFLYSNSSPPLSRVNRGNFPMATTARIAIVGDVHDDWSLEEDARALQLLKPDLVLFTGDMGNANVDLVRSISNLEFAKAIILGNHDAWSTRKFSTRYGGDTENAIFELLLKTVPRCKWNYSNVEGLFGEKDAVQLQLECLGDEHVGYRRIDFPTLKLSIVGGRPFSCGGNQLYQKKLLTARYGVRDMDQSAKRIFKAALGTPPDHSIVFLAHNGPTGLGSNIDDICGRDWIHGGGDHGDPDLAQALSQLKESTELSIPLVVFGHMHKALAHGNGLRKMIVHGNDKTVYLNGAIVPRIQTLNNENGIINTSSNSDTSNNEGTLRVFTVVDIIDGNLENIAETWVSVAGGDATIECEHILFSKVAGKL